MINKLSALIFMMAIVLAVVGMAFATNTTVVGAGTITIVLDGSTDWTSASDASLTSAKRIKSIQFNPSAANDILKIRAYSASGIVIFNSGPAGSTAPVIKYYPPDGKRVSLYIDADDLTLGTPANASVYIEYEE